MDDRERQLAEAESLEMIFADEFTPIGGWRDDPLTEVVFTVTIDPTLAVRVQLPTDYPSSSRPLVELMWSGVGDISAFRHKLVDFLRTCSEGEEVIFDIVSWCRDEFADGGFCVTSTSTDCAAGPLQRSEETVCAAANAASEDQAAEVQHRTYLNGEKIIHPLPLGNYYRAEALGEGACGSVMIVYDDDGGTWAAKQFERAEDDGVDTTTLREIGLLRALRAADALHPNVVQIRDMADINGELCMILPAFKCSLRDALSGQALSSAKGSQVRVATGLLAGISFLHSCKTMHRDIKPGNIMLTDDLEPVLIDFSLAKIEVDHSQAEKRQPRTAKEKRRKKKEKASMKQDDEDVRHSQGVGTPIYMAPEVINSEKYSSSADMWSVGVVLMEVFDADFCAKLDQCEKEKAAQALIVETVGKLGAKPVPSLLRSLLDTNPSTRIAAQDAFERLRAAVSKDETSPAPSRADLSKQCGSNLANLSEEVRSDLCRLSALLRCSANVRSHAERYASRSARAMERPLHAIALAARLHETDLEAAPFYDLEEMEEWAYDEGCEELLDELEGLSDYVQSELVILKELDYHLY
eukprot:TRINITY_DN16711_c1_g1_i1.p1 TRINITY_DN16711_c1_g1~~TRINITY_DN16711_c1_g1_i1.p1  ORF type:complete len:581 (+),score=90.70 TRINITY_DN16711_c1_g1_i1:52-1794(+)